MLLDILPQSDDLPTVLPLKKQPSDDNVNQTESSVISIHQADTISQPFYQERIPLATSKPILASSPTYILTNQLTKNKSSLVLFDESFNEFKIHTPLAKSIIDAIWADKIEKFLLLTETTIWSLNPSTKQLQELNQIKIQRNRIFISFALLDPTTLLVAYAEWNAKYLDQWKMDKNNTDWTYAGQKPINLSPNEFINHINCFVHGDKQFISMTIYDDFYQQWRIQFQDGTTLSCIKSVLLKGMNPQMGYRVLATNDSRSNVICFIYSPSQDIVISIDSTYSMDPFECDFGIKKMTIYNDKCLIFQTVHQLAMIYTW